MTTTSAQDAYGNATKVVVKAEGDRRVFQTETTNKYGSTTSDKRLGRLTETTVVHSRRGSSQAESAAEKAVRKSAFAYHGQAACPTANGTHAGLLCREVVEPDQEELRTTTTHSYDKFGNRVRSRVDYFDDTPVPGQPAPTGIGRIKTRCDVDIVRYDDRGRFEKTVFDCLGRKLSEVAARDRQGSPTQIKRYLNTSGTRFATDRVAYTDGGSEVFRASPTGAHALTTRGRGAPSGLPKDDPAQCPADTAFHERTRVGGGSETVRCFDKLARETRSAVRGFDGTWIRTDTEYDELGRVRRVSEPHYEHETVCAARVGKSRCWTTTDYDTLGRITTLTGPDGGATGFAHTGFSTTTTNALKQTATETRNALGETVSTRDHEGGIVEFDRDAQGNVVTTTRKKPESDTTPAPTSIATTASFDLLGRMTAQNDPDQGVSAYRYNSLGELRCRQSAAGHFTVTTRDGLGRAVSRQDYRAHANAGCAALSGARSTSLEADSSWTFDTAVNGLGQPHEIRDSESGFVRTLGYDRFGRPSTSETTPGTGEAAYHEKTTHDEYGRVFQVFDASRTDGRFNENGTRHVYNKYGHPEKLQEAEGTLDGQGTFTPNTVYRTIKAVDARGNVVSETLGNGVKRSHQHDGQTGRVLGIASTRAAPGDRQNLVYQWDVLGNLKSRARGSGSSALMETFTYDNLNRLETHKLGAEPAQSVTYDGYGNIRSKAGVAAYLYGTETGAPANANAGPHAVASASVNGMAVEYVYDANGNNVSSSDGRTIAYTAFDKPSSIAKGQHTTTFAYGPDRSRFRRVDTNAHGTTTTLYLGGVEIVAHPGGAREVRRNIGGVVVETTGTTAGSCPANETHYVLRDHLGGVDVLTDGAGNEVRSHSFDPWGRPRDPADWTPLSDLEAMNIERCATRRGFTDHEMLDAVGIVHMNGRIYDPTLARFLRADPFVQFPGNLQGHNRYAYVLNNPLAHTDPSGHFVSGLFHLAFATFAAHMVHEHVLSQVPVLNAVGQVFACSVGGVGGCVGYAAHSAYAQTGSFGAALKAGAFAGVSAAAFNAVGAGPLGYGVGDGLGQLVLNAAANGVVGGVMNELQGGSFGNGFLTAGASALAKPAIRAAFGTGARGMPFRVAARAAVGGTISVATGGKFVNGAVTGAFSQLYNEERTLEEGLPEGVTITERPNGVLYEHEGASVLVQNNDPGGAIPIVTDRSVGDALYVSYRENRQLQIISGYREGSVAHMKHEAIDVYIDGYTTRETANALHSSGRFNRVSSYTGKVDSTVKPRNTAHADYNPSRNQGLFEDWVHQRN